MSKYENEIKEIIEYLNFKCNRKFKIDAYSNYKHISELLNQGYIVKDFKRIINCKSKECINTKYSKYLRPTTLFKKGKIEECLEERKLDNKNNITESFEITGYKEFIKQLRTMNYKEYLKTEHWIHFREEVFKFCHGSCQICGSTDRINVHHKSYVNRGRETFNDVVCLCYSCHSKFHDKVK